MAKRKKKRAPGGGRPKGSTTGRKGTTISAYLAPATLDTLDELTPLRGSRGKAIDWLAANRPA